MIKHQSTGDFEPVATTGDGAHAITAGDNANASTIGPWANAITAGDNANASTAGDESHAITAGVEGSAATEGRNSIAAALGIGSRAKAGDGGWIVLAARGADGNVSHVRAAKVGAEAKPGVWYSLDAEGQFIEHEHQDQEAQQGGQAA